MRRKKSKWRRRIGRSGMTSSMEPIERCSGSYIDNLLAAGFLGFCVEHTDTVIG